MAKGALARGPKVKTGGGVKKVNRNPVVNTQPTQNQPNPQLDAYNSTFGQTNNMIQDAYKQYQDQGAFNYTGPQVQQFNPGDYQQQFDASYQNAMNRFNRTMQPEFDRQRQDFQQMAAERGWDPTSQAFGDAYQRQVTNPQEQARQGAMESAFTSGLQGQSQAYGQASNTYGQNLLGQQQGFNQYATQYGAPLAGLAAFSPYFGAQAQGIQQQNQFDFLGGQNALDRQQQEKMAGLQNKYALQQIAAAPHGGGGGGGGLSLADQIALQNNSFYNNMVLAGLQNGQQMPMPGMGSGFAQGLTAGAGATIGSVLK